MKNLLIIPVVFGLFTTALRLSSPGTAAARAEVLPVELTSAANAPARLRQAETARRMVNELELTRRQQRGLLSIIDEAAILKVEAYQQQSQRLPEMIEALDDFCREDSLNHGFSPPVERRTSRLNKTARNAREELTAALIELEERARKILSRAQRERVDSPRRAHRRGGGKHRATDHDRLGDTRKALQVLREQVHPKVGKLGQHLFHPAAVEALCEQLGAYPSDTLRRAVEVLKNGTEDYPRSLADQQIAELKRLRAEINNWNLINGLHLDLAQIDQIVALYQDAAPALKAAKPMGKPARGTGFQPVERQARSLSHTLGELLVALERHVEGILNPGQREVLAKYKPCLIPPKNLKDPVRVGQANHHSGIEKWLTRARKAQPDRLGKLIDGLLEQEQRRLGPLDPAARRARKAALFRAARLAATTSDVDFELTKAQLAEQIAPRNWMTELQTTIAALSRSLELPGPIARLMLKPKFIEQLRVRESQLVQGADLGRVDLAQGPKAANCDKGCALHGKGKRSGR